jgi:hypothetical protein
MTYRSIESAIRGIVSEERLSEAALGDYKGLMALAKRKSGDEQSAMMSAADMMKKGQIKDLNMFMKAMDQSTHKAMMPFVDKKYYKALHEDLNEKKLTPAEMKKREDVAQAIERENPNMPMDKKMAIATATAKRVAEENEDEMPASPDEKRMAMKQSEFIMYVGREIGEHLAANKEFPEWMQNKLSALHQKAKDVHSSLGAHGDEDDSDEEEMNEAINLLADLVTEEELRQSILDEARGADVEDRHIIMQLRSAQDLDGNKEIRFRNKTSAKVAPKHIDKILKLHDHPNTKPVHKRQLRIAISKSHDHLKKLADQIREETSLDEAAKVTDAQINKVLGPTKNAQQGIEALKKAFKVKDNEAKAMLNRVMPKEETSLDEAQYKVPSNYAAMMQKKKKADAGQQMSDDEKKKNITTADREKLSKLASMLKKEDVQEATDKEVKMATGIAFDKRYKGSNMTGATKAIEKIRKGLSDHPRVKSALRQANEDTQVEEKEVGDHVRTSDFRMAKVRLPDGRMVYRKVKREIKV